MNDLKLLAEAVAGWGNCTEAWLDTSEDDANAVFGHIDEDGNTYPVAVIDCEQYYAGHDSLKLAKFYAAANPTAVLNLITELASRDAEVALLKADNEYLYIAAIERDQLREQVTLLRDVLSDFDKAAINSKSIIGFAGQSFKLITKMRKALAATEPKEQWK